MYYNYIFYYSHSGICMQWIGHSSLRFNESLVDITKCLSHS